MKPDLELNLQEKSLIIESLAARVQKLSNDYDEGVLEPTNHEVIDDSYQLLVKFTYDYDDEIARKGIINLLSGKELVKKVTNNEVAIHNPK